MSDRVQSDMEATREMEKRLTYFVEQRSSELQTQLSSESKQRFRSIESIKKLTSEGISTLNEQYHLNYKVREEADSDVLRRIDDESGKFMEILDDQKKTISEAEEAMLEILRLIGIGFCSKSGGNIGRRQDSPNLM